MASRDHLRTPRPLLAALGLLALLMPSGARGEPDVDLSEILVADPESAAPADPLEVLRSMSLEELLTAPVVSVSKWPENRFNAPAAIHVITSDDIRRSGARSLPEILRLSPGITVAQVDANKWAVGSRGFNDLFADKLLVLVDGRSVYSAFNSGVYWSVQDYIFEDIERIEVIRGPGGTLWGANAVNGVINIITKPAEKTKGLYLEGGVGTHYRGFGAIRYGHALGENGHLRAFLKYHDHDNYNGGIDQWDFFQAGLRADWVFPDGRLLVSGSFHDGDSGRRVYLPNVVDPTRPLLAPMSQTLHYQGGNILLSYEKNLREGSDMKFQAYWDFFIEDRFEEQRQHVFDLDFQHRIELPLGQTLAYGLGYQYAPSALRDNIFFTYSPSGADQQLFSAFVQDEMTLMQDRLRFVIGTKVEHNDYTGWEFQPNARLSWTPAERQTAWAAVSRAVQVPGRNFNDLQIPLLPTVLGQADVGPPFGSLPVFPTYDANPDLDAQELVAYELGYRVQPTDKLSFDLALFFNDYGNLITGTTGMPGFALSPGPHLAVPLSTRNGGEAETWGGELVVDWRVTDWWRMQAHYSYLEMDADAEVALAADGKDPSHMVSLRSSFDLPADLTFDVWARYVDELPAFGLSDYFDLDLRLAWSPTPDLEIALVGQNLLSPDRFEFGESGISRSQVTEVPRGGYLMASFKY